MKILNSLNLNYIFQSDPEKIPSRSNGVEDAVICSMICSAILCDEAMCDKVCEVICDTICDVICEAIDTYADNSKPNICDVYKNVV